MDVTKVSWQELSGKDLNGSTLHWLELGKWFDDPITEVVILEEDGYEKVGIVPATGDTKLKVRIGAISEPSLITPFSLEFGASGIGGGYIELPCRYENLTNKQ
jgi:hypothetical protein